MAEGEPMKILVKELNPEMWPDIEKLFGPNGACGGCWCMYWRTKKGVKWEVAKGLKNKASFRRLVRSGKAHGALAMVDNEPVGWVSFDRRVDYDRLNRSQSLACSDCELVWSVPCFYIKSGFRGMGVASALLEAVLKIMKRHGASIVEGYPVVPKNKGDRIPAAFAWTGTKSLFAKAGFQSVDTRERGKERMRITL
jgi:GNAT superfamily N-acetyltransferase